MLDKDGAELDNRLNPELILLDCLHGFVYFVPSVFSKEQSVLVSRTFQVKVLRNHVNSLVYNITESQTELPIDDVAPKQQENDVEITRLIVAELHKRVKRQQNIILLELHERPFTLLHDEVWHLGGVGEVLVEEG